MPLSAEDDVWIVIQRLPQVHGGYEALYFLYSGFETCQLQTGWMLFTEPTQNKSSPKCIELSILASLDLEMLR